MLSKVLEWYRIAELKPNNETVEARANAIRDFITKIENASDYDLLIGTVAAAVRGFDSFKNNSEVVSSLVDNIRNYQPFPSDLSENAMALRACALITIGELIVRDQQKKSIPDLDGQIAASLIATSTSLYSKPRGKFLRVIVDETRAAALANLERSSKAVRRSRTFDPTAINNVTAEPDLATFWKQLQPAITAGFVTVERETSFDRERVDVLWWLYTCFSSRLGEPLAELDSCASAFACGREIADLMKAPAPGSVQQMLIQALRKDRQRASLSSKPLTEWIAACKPEAFSLLSTEDSNAQRLIADFPFLLPLSWLCTKLSHGSVKSGWEAEFSARTGLASDKKVTPYDIAWQCFNERVAQRIYASGFSN